MNRSVTRPGQLMKIDIGKPFDKSKTMDINNINIINFINQSIKIDTHNSSGYYCSPYVSYGASKENLSIYQDILSLVISSFILIT